MKLFLSLVFLASCYSPGGGTWPPKDPPPNKCCPADAPPPQPDAYERLGPCDKICPGEELTPWPSGCTDGSCQYMICLPSYKHCCVPSQCGDDSH